MKHFSTITLGPRRTAGRYVVLASCCALSLAAWTSTLFAQETAVQKDLGLFYQQNCARCHGPEGTGLDATGKRLHGQDFTDASWLKDTRDDEMVKVILKGKFFGLAMPAFKDSLTQEEAMRLVTDVVRKSEKGKLIEPGSQKPAGAMK